MKLSKKYCIS